MIDSLTGVLNRRAFLDHADGEWVRHRRHGHALACVMIDVDGFKKINDTFGMRRGTRCCSISALLCGRRCGPAIFPRGSAGMSSSR